MDETHTVTTQCAKEKWLHRYDCLDFLLMKSGSLRVLPKKACSGNGIFADFSMSEIRLFFGHTYIGTMFTYLFRKVEPVFLRRDILLRQWICSPVRGLTPNKMQETSNMFFSFVRVLFSYEKKVETKNQRWLPFGSIVFSHCFLKVIE